MTTPTRRVAPAPRTRTASGTRLYQVLAGLAALGILLQGVWAGLFIRPGEPNDGTWVFVHARCAEVTIAAAVAAAAVAVWRLRARRDLLLGSGALVVLLVVEAYVGGEVFRRPGLAVLHIPLALALMGLAVWLPLRARR
jgi:heme A synthase